jgi:beta-glucosidase
VALLDMLKVDAYRLSIAWPRVMTADGQPNQAGIAFYRKLLQALRAKGMKTFVTLYHWDLPQHLEDQGGWTNRATAYRFAEYADMISRELAGLVDAWATPERAVVLGVAGLWQWPPRTGKQDVKLATQAMHHLLLGMVWPWLICAPTIPPRRQASWSMGHATTTGNSAADQRAAMLFEVQNNQWVLDPLLKQRYPAALWELWPDADPVMQEGDLAIIGAKVDYLGINYYFRSNVVSDGRHGYTEVPLQDVERTQMGWEVYPDGLRHLLVGFKRDYPHLPPIYITENGMASDDKVVDGVVNDSQRISFFNRHLAAVDQAVKAGVDVRGYFIWSLLDNFEWAGYERRFGIVHVDYATQQRTPKRSAQLVQQFSQRGAANNAQALSSARPTA